MAHTGAMIAAKLRDEDAERLAVENGEPVDELHLTLLFLGEAAAIPEDTRDRILNAVATVAEKMNTVNVEAFAVSVFNPPGVTRADGMDRDTCVTALVSDPSGDLVALRGAVEEIFLDEALGFEMPRQHSPWQPHVTLAYIETTDVAPYVDRVGPLVVDGIRVAFGGDVYDIPLGDDETQVESHSEALLSDVDVDDFGEIIVPNVLLDLRGDVEAFYDPSQPRDTEGKWTDGPRGSLADRIELTPSDDTSFEPNEDTLATAQTFIGRNITAQASFLGADYTINGKLTDVGDLKNGAKGVTVTTGTGEKFFTWSLIRSMEVTGDNDDDDDKEDESPYSQVFEAAARDARTDPDEVMSVVPYISESAPIAQHWALTAYEAEGYRPINTGLRTGKLTGTMEQDRGEDGVVRVSVRESVRALDRLMAGSTTSDAVVTYRGVKSLKNTLGLSDVNAGVSLEGLEWRDPAYTSTSASRGRATSFTDKRLGEGGAVLRVLVPKGTNAVSLGSSEHEVLLNRGLRYRIIADNGVVNGVRQLDVEVVR